jgi:hypothetical protein
MSKPVLTRKHLRTALQEMGACDAGYGWADGQSPAAAWNRCNNYHWMMWAATSLPPMWTPAGRKRIVRAVLAVIKAGAVKLDSGEEVTVRAVRRWLSGQLPLDRLKRFKCMNPAAVPYRHLQMCLMKSVTREVEMNWAGDAISEAAIRSEVLDQDEQVCDIIRRHLPYKVMATAVQKYLRDLREAA